MMVDLPTLRLDVELGGLRAAVVQHLTAYAQDISEMVKA